MNNTIEDLGKVGIIIDDWNIRRAYPFKTFVTDYSTWVSYISRRPVPAGTPITDITYWKPVLKPDKQMYSWLQDIDNKIDSFLESIGGTAISTKFGNSDLVGISQRVLTESINRIWDKIDELTGEDHRHINMIITPDFFIGDECTITMAASATETGGIFDYIEFLINGQSFEGNSAESVNSFTCTSTITEECDVTCNVRILGQEYSVTKHVGHNDGFWIGAGSSYSDVFNNQHAVRLNNFKGNYNITFAQNNYLFIIVPSQHSDIFTRADLNGIEIPMISETITVDDTNYIVYKSSSSYSAGNYNIDINS